jgi:C4-dicarboxylate-specific signal transduction histidine kinase
MFDKTRARNASIVQQLSSRLTTNMSCVTSYLADIAMYHHAMYTLLQLAAALQQLHQLLRRRKKRRRLTWVAAWTCKCTSKRTRLIAAATYLSLLE